VKYTELLHNPVQPHQQCAVHFATLHTVLSGLHIWSWCHGKQKSPASAGNQTTTVWLGYPHAYCCYIPLIVTTMCSKVSKWTRQTISTTDLWKHSVHSSAVTTRAWFYIIQLSLSFIVFLTHTTKSQWSMGHISEDLWIEFYCPVDGWLIEQGVLATRSSDSLLSC
jgi:hypothetical protein